MKILRIRRGFTTNSSAYTEWLPPPAQTGTTTTQGQAAGAPATITAPVTPGTTVPAPAAQGASAPPAGHATGNALTLVGIVGALVAVFVTERVIRRLRRGNSRPDEDADE